MTIFHRPFSAGFGRGRHTTTTPKSHLWAWGHAEKSEFVPREREGTMTSYPWEGLYLEADETIAPPCEAAQQPNTQLGLFLTSLMYGE